MTREVLEQFIATVREHCASGGGHLSQTLEFHVGPTVSEGSDFVDLDSVSVDEGTVRLRIVPEEGCPWIGAIERLDLTLPLPMVCALKEVLWDNGDGTKSKHFKMVVNETVGGGMYEWS